MAPVAAPAAANGDAPAAAPASWYDSLFPYLRIFLFWYAFQSITGGGGFASLFGAKPQPQKVQSQQSSFAVDDGSAPAAASVAAISQGNAASQAAMEAMAKPLHNAFSNGESLQLRVYVSPDETFVFEGDLEREQEQLRWFESDVPYVPSFAALAAEDEQLVKHLNVTVDAHLLSNGSLFAHIFLTRAQYSPNPNDPDYDHMATVYRQIPLTAYRPRPKIVVKRNLLGGTTTDDTDEQAQQQQEQQAADNIDPDTFVSLWKPKFAINFVHDQAVFQGRVQPPPFMAPYMELDRERGLYLPALFLNEFWLLEDMLLPVNDSVVSLPLEMSFYPLPMYKLALYTQMEQNFKNQEMAGASTKRDNDKMKRMFVDTNPYLLGITFAVSLLHSLFDFLAFKNDVSFWKNQKSLEGLSLRTIVLNSFFQLVIFLYLMDNDTSWMILISSGISLVIEVWKIKKAMVISRDENNKLVFASVESYSDSPTAEHDRVAVAHLSYVLYPLIVGNACYSLTYGVHKGWYSWVLSSLTSFVYAFGFIMMTPQLYINYKLKSVAHLPWRAMVYKSLNTFIDDLFAFVIHMPWMHRLSCFRDDLIFFIYLYQRWKYPVDKTRVNEFGQGPSPEEEAQAALAAETTVTEIEENEATSSTEYMVTKRKTTTTTTTTTTTSTNVQASD